MAESDVFFYIITKQTMAKKQPQTRAERHTVSQSETVVRDGSTSRARILDYAKKKFGKCNYQERIESAPQTVGKRFIRTYKSKSWETVARLYSYESTGTVYFKDFLNKKSFQW